MTRDGKRVLNSSSKAVLSRDDGIFFSVAKMFLNNILLKYNNRDQFREFYIGNFGYC